MTTEAKRKAVAKRINAAVKEFNEAVFEMYGETDLQWDFGFRPEDIYGDDSSDRRILWVNNLSHTKYYDED